MIIREWPYDCPVNPSRIEMLDIKFFFPKTEKRWGPWGMFRRDILHDVEYQVGCKLAGSGSYRSRGYLALIAISKPFKTRKEAETLRDEIAERVFGRRLSREVG